MRHYFTVTLAAIAMILCVPSHAITNRYGMKLAAKGGRMYVVDSVKLDRLGIAWRTLPDVLEPYTPANIVYDNSAAVEPETIFYKTGVSGEQLPLMVYRSNTPNAPVVFYIHGGGWTAGTYKSCSQFCTTLAGKYGITVVSIEYTFATVKGARMEDTIEDCYDAVNYILSRDKEFGIDPSRIGFMGSSAGGYLSAVCAMHFPQTKALAGWYGAYDLISTMEVYAPESNPQKHSQYDTFLDGWNKKHIISLSPYYIARKSHTNFKAILFEGTADITIGPGNAEKLRASLEKAGNTNVEVHRFENVTHTMFSSYAADEIYLSTLNLFTSKL